MPKIVCCRSNGVACGQYKDKEERTPKKNLKGPKNVKNENFEKQTKKIPQSKRTYLKKLGYWVKNCDL